MSICVLTLGTIGPVAAEPAQPAGTLEVFPVDFQKGRYSFIEGFPHVFYCGLKGSASAMADAQLVVDLPDGFEYVGSSPLLATQVFHGTNDTRGYPPDAFTTSRVERSGAPYTRYSIAIDRTVTARIQGVDRPVPWANYIRLYLRTRPGAASGAVLYLKACWSEARHSTEETAITADLLPPLEPPRRRAEQFQLYIGMPNQAAAPFPEVAEAYRRYWTALSPRPWTKLLPAFSALPTDIRRLIDPPFRIAASIGGGFSTPGHLTRGFEGRYAGVLMADGTYHSMPDGRTAICPSWMAADPDGIFESMVTNDITGRAFHKVPRPEAIMWDFEPTTTYCYCQACLSQFAAFAGLDAPPPPASVKPGGPLARRWFDFRVQQHAAIQARYYAALKKHYPDIPFWICTDPLHAPPEAPLRDWCGVDERLGDDHCDLHTPMIYYAGLRFFEDLAFNRQHLKKPIFVLIDPAEMMERYFIRYTPQTVKQNILAAAALGCMGFGFWPDDALDGRYLTRIAEGFGLVGLAEAYYAGARDDAAAVIRPRNVAEKAITGEDSQVRHLMEPPFNRTIKHTAHRAGGGLLVTLLNYDEKADAILSVSVPGFGAGIEGPGSVRDLETGRFYAHADGTPIGASDIQNGFLTHVPKDGVVLLELAAGPARLESGTLRQDAWAAMLTGPAAADSTFPSKKSEHAFVDWGLLEAGSAPSLVLAARPAGTGAFHRVFVNVGQKASAAAWKPGTPAGVDYLGYGTRGFLGELVFYDEPAGLSFPYRLRSMDIRGNIPEAVFECRPQAAGADPESYALAGLEIEKTLTLEDDGRRLRIRFSFRNVSRPPASIPVGFRTKNIPAFGGRGPAGAAAALNEDTQIGLSTPNGPAALRPEGHSTLLLPADVPPPPFAAKVDAIPRQAWKVSPLVLTAKAGGTLTLFPDPAATAGVYLWRDSRLFTVEFLSVPRDLAAGETFAYEYTVNVKP